MSSAMGDIGVVSFDPESFTVIWKDIPGFSSYEASNLGTIRHKRIGRIANIYEVDTSVGSYLRTSAMGDDDKTRSKEVHYLVCAAFNGAQPTPDHEVNHINGNKHCNLPTNLEWLTRGDNLKHAYKEGLRKENRRVEVYDHKDGVTVEYYSMAELARSLHVGKNQVWTIVTNHKTKPYHGRYTFKFVNPEGVKSNKHARVKAVKALDYSTRKLIVANDLAQMELLCGVKRGTIYYNLTRGKTELVRGHVFLYMDSTLPFPSYTEEQIVASLKPSNGRNNAIKVTDTLSNTTEVYASFPDFAKAIGVKHPDTIRRQLKPDGLYQHYLIEKL